MGKRMLWKQRELSGNEWAMALSLWHSGMEMGVGMGGCSFPKVGDWGETS